MKITVDPEEVLMNFEVLEVLRDHRKKRKSQLRVRQHRMAGMTHTEEAENVKIVSNQVISYLERTPANSQTSEHYQKIKEQLDDYDLAPAEYEMVVNLRPSKPAQLMPIVEDGLERFSEKDLEAIAEHVEQCLPPAPELQVLGADGDPEENNLEDYHLAVEDGRAEAGDSSKQQDKTELENLDAGKVNFDSEDDDDNSR
ncbi:hypothetical protein NDN08_002423 [Rhodosorus marinus]|uniref:DNA-directed RNA polymerase III subunit RPC9 n=1 Tax=Rhodosorus marinus TaxID=101924 RepID=A0AAV8UY39_9RHOD|nr:hypothetical protein NDN08_002423 [Rhodosorus marinus]